jgi:hypothetical protein
MREQAGPIYEVTLNIDGEVAGDIDDWLADHIEEMLLIPGFISANVFSLEDDQDRIRRVTHYQLEDYAALEQYLAGPASVMRQSTVEKFGDRFEAERRILNPVRDASEIINQEQECLNCGSSLTGQYCGNCGQRARSRLISIWELLRDAFGDLLEIDSKIWQTLVPLAIRPGRLTSDYLRGRRARFMPPFRTYLVLSLLFFLVAFFDPQDQLGILFEPSAETTTEQTENEQTVRDEVLRELIDEGIVVNSAIDEPIDGDETDGLSITVDGEKIDTQCDLEDFDPADMPAWLAKRLTKERLQVMCERMTAEDGQGLKGFLDKLRENVPAGLFLLLPLMALVLNILYPLSKRYYVEHLLFVVHYHAFIFLALIFEILYLRLAEVFKFPETITTILVMAISIYIAVYLFKAMRCVYGQGRWVTVFKYILLLFAYVVGLALIMGSAAIFAAFSI